MQRRLRLPLAISLLMFPQFAQTLYSPALADFARVFAVPPEAASQAVTVYFLAFAFGVVGWGRACDQIGRRAAMLCGLALYAVASALALAVTTFEGLLATQALAAVGAAAGSVVTQTLLRDRFAGAELAKVFSIVGMMLAASPAVGLFAGAGVVQAYGYHGAVLCLLLLALGLLGWTAASLPETRPAKLAPAPLRQVCAAMVRDTAIWRDALLVAVFNIALYSYYALGPFLFERLHAGPQLYGYSGVVLAAGSSAGAWLNKRLLKRGVAADRLTAFAALLMLAAGIALQFLQHTLWLLAPMLLVVLGFGIAIPNVLGRALASYRAQLGTAGALFGLAYYLMIGTGMLLVGWSQAPGATVIVCGGLATAACAAPYNFMKIRRQTADTAAHPPTHA
ncbi:MFS transporter [Bordetella sp. H567]|uniref:MFS transporter n=1 Tax=Bordetella sp. H567 TaxID=1697043 RepID=UPI0008336877|nr:MFS transporter [Bordetella sp. H567]